MFSIGLISDTHDNVTNIIKSVKIFKERKVKLVLHLGDIVAPATVAFFNGLNMHFVKGNCDGDIEMIKKRVAEIHGSFSEALLELELNEKRIAALHGNDKEVLEELIRSGKYDFVFHGHTHKQRNEKLGRTRVVNPGAHYFTAEPKSIAIVDIVNDFVEFIEV